MLALYIIILCCCVDGFLVVVVVADVVAAYCLLAEQNLAASAHILASLGGALVGASLQTDDRLASVQHLIGEFTLCLIGWLGAQLSERKAGVLPGL